MREMRTLPPATTQIMNREQLREFPNYQRGTKVINCNGWIFVNGSKRAIGHLFESVDTIPDGVEKLDLSFNFNLARISRIPPSLVVLNVSETRVEFDDDPEEWGNIRKLICCFSSASLPNLRGFRSIECIDMETYDTVHSLETIFIPESLRCMTITASVLDASILPRCLERLTITGTGDRDDNDYIQVVETHLYPKTMKFMALHGLVIDDWEDFFPRTLIELHLIDCTVESVLDSVNLPDSIETLFIIRAEFVDAGFKFYFLPLELRCLKLFFDTQEQLKELQFPQKLEFLGMYGYPPIRLPPLPVTLRTLLFDNCGEIDEMPTLPNGLTSLILRGTHVERWNNEALPVSVRLFESAQPSIPMELPVRRENVNMKEDSFQHFLIDFLLQYIRPSGCHWCSDKINKMDSYGRTYLSWDKFRESRVKSLLLLCAIKYGNIWLPNNLVSNLVAPLLF